MLKEVICKLSCLYTADGPLAAYVLLAMWAISSSPRLAKAGGPKEGSWPNISIAEISKSFWIHHGPPFPSKDFVQAVKAASFRVTDKEKRPRQMVLMSMASESTLRATGENPSSIPGGYNSTNSSGSSSGGGLWELFLSSLKNITFTRRDGTQDHLAAHLVAVLLTLPGATSGRCTQISKPYGARCVTTNHRVFTADDYGYRTPPFFGLSFVKTLTLLNTLTLGVDVLFLDSDQIFFRNPLPYIVSRDIDILVAGDCSSRLDTVPQSYFQSNVKTNIGLLYMRSKPLVTRAVANWLHQIVQRAPSGRPVLDQTAFPGAMEGVSGAMGERAMSLALLRSEYFPHWCIAECGCDTEGLDLGQLGWGVRRRWDGVCEPELMRRWYNFHVPCTQGMDFKVRNLLELLSMYTIHVGRINSLSEPVDVI